MRHILFVDDDRHVLDGLRNLLRRDRHRWALRFANSGEEALAELERQPADILISDMRMPGMDGAALLATARHLFPETARIILSGQADRESVVRAAPVAQQFLTKPCQPDILRGVIERILDLRDRLSAPTLRHIVGSVRGLPASPEVYWEFKARSQRGGATVEELTAIIQQDAAMSIKVLQMANSPILGLRQPVADLAEAMTVLGLEMTTALVLSAPVFVVSERQGSNINAHICGLQARSLLVANLVSRLLPEDIHAGTAFTAALIHDIGRVILHLGVPEGCKVAWATAHADGRPLYLVEREVIGAGHPEVGAYMLALWGLPLSLVEVAALHHAPSDSPSCASHLLAAVHVVTTLVADGSCCAPNQEALDLAFIERIGLADELPRWLEVIAEASRQSACPYVNTCVAEAGEADP